ncbi:stress-induced protein YchH [Proteus myxofaciens]|uniref:Putative membrane protein n=1 Tax=Proteus myxofaciens ATCC 19692 TaxID=1354337 RepID=A0A198GP71_9GAMM|nr:stress-induced protein YchH [Proteus myxofaciens]OAT38664.1 putative membrane protein [Proteus myxofaciens ATCC 19692]
MKYKHAFAMGNFLMAVGMVTMLGSLGYNLISHIFPIGLPEILADLSLMGIFIGAFVWLAGARIGGRETVAERYWWLRHYDERYRRHNNHRFP